MTQEFGHEADAVLDRAVQGVAPVAGVVAVVTDREGTVYEGTAAVRRLGGDDPMTTDTVFALYSCTKAITARAHCSWSRKAGSTWTLPHVPTPPRSASCRCSTASATTAC